MEKKNLLNTKFNKLDRVLLEIAQKIIKNNKNFVFQGIGVTYKGDLNVEFTINKDKKCIISWSFSERANIKPISWIYEMPVYLYGPSNPNEYINILSLFKDTIRKVWEDGGEQWLEKRNREVFEAEYSVEGFISILPKIIAMGEIFWKEWHIEKVTLITEKNNKAKFEIKIGNVQEQYKTLILDPHRKIGSDEKLLTNSQLGYLSIKIDNKNSDKLHSLADKPENAFGFLLSRGTHRKIRWKSIEEGNIKQIIQKSNRRNLIDYCFRSWTQWGEKPSLFFSTWGDQDFLSNGAVLEQKYHLLIHGSRECPNCSTILSDNFQCGPLPWSSSKKSLNFTNFSTTDLDDSSIIFGGENKLREAILFAKQTKDENKELRVVCNCEYEIIGDNTDGICKEFTSAVCPVKYQQQSIPNFQHLDTPNWWQKLLTDIKKDNTKKISLGINLVGYGHPWEKQICELETILDKLGIKIISTVLPSPDITRIDKFSKSTLTVVRPWKPVTDTIIPLLKETNIKIILPPAPYGIRGTIEWLKTICFELGIEKTREPLINKLADEYTSQWNNLINKFENLKISLLADIGTIEEMCLPDFFFGFNPAEFFKETGCVFYLFQTENNTLKIKVESNHLSTETIILNSYNENNLSKIFADYPTDLIYSDVSDGAAVKSLGTNPFDIKSFEMGLAGAVRTVKRLLALSQIKLYKNYSSYIP